MRVQEILCCRDACPLSFLYCRDSDIRDRSGPDASLYLLLERYIIVILLVISVLSLAIILPVNYTATNLQCGMCMPYHEVIAMLHVRTLHVGFGGEKFHMPNSLCVFFMDFSFRVLYYMCINLKMSSVLLRSSIFCHFPS